VEITALLPWLREKGLPFTPTIVYLVARTANEIPEFRWRIRGDEVIEHESVQPSFTVWTEVADVFSFCTVPYSPDFIDFTTAAQEKMARMKATPSLEDEENRDDFLFLSAIPWVSFTSFQHAMQLHPHDAVPRITWGKYFEENGRIKMPLSVQVHHAIVDGRHVGAYFQQIEALAMQPEQLV
jgi:chloramphenicol O-acetyltransferase type A